MVRRHFDDLRNKYYGKLISFKKKIGLVDVSVSELYHSAILLKNLAIVRKDYPMSQDYMIEELAIGSDRLKPIFQHTLSLLRSGKQEEGFDYFSSAIGNKYGKNFASILSKMDKVNPYELVSQIEVYINVIREVRTTEAIREADRNSLICTAFSVATCFTVLINFCVVVVLLDTLYSLSNYF